MPRRPAPSTVEEPEPRRAGVERQRARRWRRRSPLAAPPADLGPGHASARSGCGSTGRSAWCGGRAPSAPSATLRVLPGRRRLGALLQPAEPRAVAGSHLARGPGRRPRVRRGPPLRAGRPPARRELVRERPPRRLWVNQRHPERSADLVVWSTRSPTTATATPPPSCPPVRAAWVLATAHLGGPRPGRARDLRRLPGVDRARRRASGRCYALLRPAPRPRGGVDRGPALGARTCPPSPSRRARWWSASRRCTTAAWWWPWPTSAAAGWRWRPSRST